MASPFTWVEVVFGLPFVVIYACERFNTPTTNRSSTTAFRYYSGAGAYTLFAVALYLAFTRIQAAGALRMAFGGAEPPEYLASMKSPFMAALVVTVLLPTVPVLNTLDQHVRRWLHRFAQIPTEALRLSHKLHQATVETPPSLKMRVTRTLLGHGFVEADLIAVEARDIKGRARTLATLMARLDELKSDPRVSPFLVQSEVHAALDKTHAELLEQLARCLKMQRESASGPDQRGNEALAAWMRSLDEQLRGQLEDTCDLVSRVVLLSGRTHAVRAADLASFGFQLDEAKVELTWDQTVLVFLSLTGISLLAHMLAHASAPASDTSALDLLVRSVVVAVAATVAVLCATLPKALWSFAQRRPGRARPWFFYMLAAMMGAATVAGLLLLVLLLVTLRFDTAWQTYMQYTSWLILAAAMAGITAFQTDNVPNPRLSPKAWRLLEGAIEALLLAAAALLALWDFNARQLVGPNAYAFLAGTAVAGFVVGACVPTWHRKVPETLRLPNSGGAEPPPGRLGTV